MAQVAPQLAGEIESAGTANYHVGDPPDLRSQRAALRRGIDLSGLRARQVVPEDFMRFDLILAMDRENLRDLQRMRPKVSTAELRLFLEYAQHLDTLEVPDPYYGDDAGFEEVLDLAAAASRGLIACLQQGSKQPIQGAGKGDGNGQSERPAAAIRCRKPPHRSKRARPEN